MGEFFLTATRYLDFSQNPFAPHLLSDVPGVTNVYLWDRWRVKEQNTIGSREKGKGGTGLGPSLPASIAPPAFRLSGSYL